MKVMEPYEIHKKIGPKTYDLDLPSHLENLHNIFHVFESTKYVHDPSQILELDDVHIREDSR